MSGSIWTKVKNSGFHGHYQLVGMVCIGPRKVIILNFRADLLCRHRFWASLHSHIKKATCSPPRPTVACRWWGMRLGDNGLDVDCNRLSSREYNGDAGHVCVISLTSWKKNHFQGEHENFIGFTHPHLTPYFRQPISARGKHEYIIEKVRRRSARRGRRRSQLKNIDRGTPKGANIKLPWNYRVIRHNKFTKSCLSKATMIQEAGLFRTREQHSFQLLGVPWVCGGTRLQHRFFTSNYFL